jgi:uncharacterized membrane-anchored protein
MNVRFLIFCLRIVLIFLVIFLLVQNPGQIQIDWYNYEVKTSLSFILFVFLILLFVVALFSAGWGGGMWILRKALNLEQPTFKKDADTLVAKALCALEFGNLKEAKKLSFEALKLLPNSALPGICLLKAGQLLKEKKTEQLAFSHLKKFKDFAPLALHGEIEDSIKSGKLGVLKSLTKQASLLYKDEGWLLKQSLKELFLNQSWKDALEALKKAEKKGAYTPEEVAGLQAMIWYQLSKEPGIPEFEIMGRMQNSYDADSSFLPNILSFAPLLKRRKDLRSAKVLLEKAWNESPSWPIAQTYCDLMAEDTKALTRAHKARDLYDLQPEHPVSILILIIYLIQAQLWGEALRYLELIPSKVPEALILKAALAKKERGSIKEALVLLMRAMEKLSLPYKCGSCKSLLAEWNLMCPKCSSFQSVYLKHPITYLNCLSALE